MAQQTIGIGEAANDGTGDKLRDAFSKVEANFTDLYAQEGRDPDSFVINASAITGLTGGGATKLDGIATLNLSAGRMIALRPSTLGTHTTYIYQLFAGTAPESALDYPARRLQCLDQRQILAAAKSAR